MAVAILGAATSNNFELVIGGAVVFIAILVGLLFFVTSADSGALVMSKFSSISKDPQQDGAPWMRLMWSGAVAVLTIAMLQVGGISTLQMATLIMGLPFMVVVYLIMVGMVRSIRLETAQRYVVHIAKPASRIDCYGVAGSRI